MSTENSAAAADSIHNDRLVLESHKTVDSDHYQGENDEECVICMSFLDVNEEYFHYKCKCHRVTSHLACTQEMIYRTRGGLAVRCPLCRQEIVSSDRLWSSYRRIPMPWSLFSGIIRVAMSYHILLLHTILFPAGILFYRILEHVVYWHRNRRLYTPNIALWSIFFVLFQLQTISLVHRANYENTLYMCTMCIDGNEVFYSDNINGVRSIVYLSASDTRRNIRGDQRLRLSRVEILAEQLLAVNESSSSRRRSSNAYGLCERSLVHSAYQVALFDTLNSVDVERSKFGELLHSTLWTPTPDARNDTVIRLLDAYRHGANARLLVTLPERIGTLAIVQLIPVITKVGLAQETYARWNEYSRFGSDFRALRRSGGNYALVSLVGGHESPEVMRDAQCLASYYTFLAMNDPTTTLVTLSCSALVAAFCELFARSLPMAHS